MAKSVCILIRNAPYGRIQAAEAVRHINGAVSNGFDTTAIFVDDGVYAVKANQDPGQTEFTNLAQALTSVLSKPEPKAKLLVHRYSAGIRGLAEPDLIPGVMFIDDPAFAQILAGTPRLMLF